jgi:hypothetical protein
MNYMNKKTIVATIMVVALLTASASAALAYNEPGPAGAPVCNSEKPQKAWLYRVKSLGGGKYQLFWDKADRATSWTIGFGIMPGKYIYGLNDFGNDQSRNLTVDTFSNKKFYFVIKANNGCMPGEWSNEWKVGTAAPVFTPAAGNTTLNDVDVVVTPPVAIITPVISEKPVVTTIPFVTKAPVKGIIPPVATPTPAKGGFWNWLMSLFK